MNAREIIPVARKLDIEPHSAGIFEIVVCVNYTIISFRTQAPFLVSVRVR